MGCRASALLGYGLTGLVAERMRWGVEIWFAPEPGGAEVIIRTGVERYF